MDFRKKLRGIAALCLALLLAAPFALGEGDLPEGYELTPEEHAVMPEGEYDFVIIDRPRFMLRGAQNTIETITTPSLGVQGVWQVVCEAEGATFRFQMCNVDRQEGNTIYLSTLFSQQTFSENDTFSYTLNEPNTYYIYCHIKDAGGSVQSIYQRFVIEEGEDAATVSTRVKEIVAECCAGVTGEYEKALRLHDWITTHSYYDLSYANHGADSILFHGLGVCDSYSKLYQLFMEEVGIESRRVVGSSLEGGSHSWNLVKLNGVWCHIDCSWDDPAGEEVAVSGNESREYFGGNDAMMKLDHVYTVETPCTSLSNFYAYRTKEYQQWMRHVWKDFENGFAHAAEFDVNTKGIVIQGVSEDGTQWYYTGKNTVDRRTTIAGMLMSLDEWAYRGGRTIRAAFTYDPDRQSMHCRAVRDDDAPALRLPAETREIDNAAFEGDDSLYSVILPEGVATIGPRAFADCAALTWVVVPSPDTEIAEDAFDGVPEGYIIVCAGDSKAADFARNHEDSASLLTLEPDEAQS